MKHLRVPGSKAATRWPALVAATVVSICLAVGGAAAQTDLPAADRAATIARLEAYLNSVRSLESRFVQSSSNGDFAQGRLYVQKPRRLRLDYDQPSSLQVYADGYWLVYADTELEEATHVPLSRTPAAFLVEKNVSLTGSVRVTGITQDDRTLRVEVVQSDEPEAGSVILAFDRSPLKLKTWTVIDAQGIRTQVGLVRPVFNKPIEDKIFEFDPDRFRPPRHDG